MIHAKKLNGADHNSQPVAVMGRPILINEPPPAVTRSLAEAPESAWKYLGWTGILFAVVGLSDIGIAWYPIKFGTPEWEFGIASTTMENLPLTIVGLSLVFASGVARGRRRVVLALTVVLAILALAVLALGIMFALDVPLALRAVPNEPAHSLLQRGMLKTAIQTVVYFTLLGSLTIAGLKQASGNRKG